MTGYDIAKEAWSAFEAWRSEQSDEVAELTLLEQIDLYAEATG